MLDSGHLTYLGVVCVYYLTDGRVNATIAAGFVTSRCDFSARVRRSKLPALRNVLSYISSWIELASPGPGW